MLTLIGRATLAAALWAGVASVAAQPTLATVDKVDLERYVGRWYEIARLPNRFQSQCAGDVTATYTALSATAVRVTNACRTHEGETDSSEGVARVRDTTTNAKLEVRFLPLALAWLPFAWGDYWILDLAPDYSHALVGTPSRETLWILSRRPELDAATYGRLVAKARALGFPTDKLVRTRHAAP